MRSKLLVLLLLAFTAINAQDVGIVKLGDTLYAPALSSTGVTQRQLSYFIVTPPGYKPEQRYPLKVIVHGKGERSEGKIEGLRNLAQGAVYVTGGPRLYPFIPDDAYRMSRDSGFIIAVPNYTPTKGMSSLDVDFIIAEAQRHYNIDTDRISLWGFSMGGGIVSAYISTAGAAKLQYAVLASPVNSLSNTSYIKATSLPVITISATTDNVVSASTSDAIANSINNSGTAIKAYRIKMPGTGHGGLNEMLSIYNTSIPQSIYAYEAQVTKDGPKAYPLGNTPPPQPPVTGAPVLRLGEVPAVTTTGLVNFEACSTTGFDAFTWTVVSVPKTASLWAPYLTGAGFCRAAGKFTIEGAYAIKATACKGSACVTDTIYVTYQKTSTPLPVTAITFDSATGLLVLSDGTRVAATAVIDFKAGTAVATTSDGKTYNLK